LAAPWFVYQLAVHGRWFRAEHIGVEILGFGAGSPPQTSQENQILFYLTRAALLDPVLLAAAAVALPSFAGELRRRSAPAILLLLSLALPAAAVLVWQYRNVAYLLPLVPFLAILAAAYNPLSSGRSAKWLLTLVAAAFAAKAALPSVRWGLPFRAGTNVAVAPLLSAYCQRARGNELILVDTPDELYASLLPVPKVRYVLQGIVPTPGKYGLDFASMGIILSAQQFIDLPRGMPAFRQSLRAWGLESVEPVGAVIFVRSPEETAAIVATHPDSDFFLPADRAPLPSAAHDAVKVSADYFLLLSRHALPAPAARWSCRL
jgi:hypothetical protein